MIEKERAEFIYRTMNRIRQFELCANRLFEENKLRGSVHVCLGEEATPATVCSRLTAEDYIGSTHRGHGHCIAKGASLKNAMAELMGKETGYCRGRGGSMHISDITKGNLGANAIVGGSIPISAGAALACKYLKNNHVAVSFFGDGAANEGTFHETLNMAALWKLPVIFICENNGYGISTPTWQSVSVEHISERAKAYGIPGETVDGDDVEAIDEAFAKALERAKAGEGPTLLECVTHRWFGHWLGDPQVYRPAEEINSWKNDDWKKEHCPIRRYRQKLLAYGTFTEEELDKMETEALKEVEEAKEFALSSPVPDPATVMDNVFYEEGANVNERYVI